MTDTTNEKIKQIISDRENEKVEFKKSFSLSKENGGINGGINGTLNGTLNQREKLVYNLILGKPGIQAKEIMETLKIPRDTLNKYLKHMIIEKFIEHRGSKKTGGYWEVMKK